MTHLGDRLSALLDGELGAPERGDTELHLARCAPCLAELSAIASVRGRLRELPALELPPSLLPAGRSRRRWVPSPAWVSAVAATAAITVGLLVGPGEPGAAFQLDTLNEQHTARLVGDPGIATFRGDRP